MSRNILVTGGSGYIGSVISVYLKNSHNKVYHYDNLSASDGLASKKYKIPIFEGDILDVSRLTYVLKKYNIDTVVHLAAKTSVAESISNPEVYYNVNVKGTECVIDSMKVAGVKNIIFSSTAAVYGDPITTPITESHSLYPTSVYGFTKQLAESAIMHSGLNYLIFRYFNVAGADMNYNLGECHNPETHLIPIAIDCAVTGKTLQLYGDDYDTPDGTCIRDYIHVTDVAIAHTLALNYLTSGYKPIVFNLGHSTGLSVKTIINNIQSQVGKPINLEIMPRRLGDPAVLVSDYTRARHLLNWKPLYSSIDRIVNDAYKWYMR